MREKKKIIYWSWNFSRVPNLIVFDLYVEMPEAASGIAIGMSKRRWENL